MRHVANQVDGAYEDWVEVLRLVYHSGTQYAPLHTLCIP